MHGSTLPKLAVLLMLGAGCSRKPAAPSEPSPAASSARAPVKAPSAPAPVANAWFEDDYAGALAAARSRGVPLFVDAAASWCHTCLAMRAFVLDPPGLDKSGFVWFSFDVERPENERVVARYPARSLPTFFIVDPTTESVHGRWEGAATLDQIREFLKDGQHSIDRSRAGSLAPGDPLALLVEGHRAAMQKDYAVAATSFGRALAAAPSGWSRRSDARQSQLVALRRAGRFEACFEAAASTFAEGATGALGRSSVLADFAAAALACTDEAKVSEARKRAFREQVTKTLAEVARDPAAPMSPDDRADAWRIVWDAHESLGDRESALEAARARLSVIEAAVRQAPNARVATTFDGARLETLVFLGRAREAAGFLSERERELPSDYNPSHRLAVAYEAAGEHEKALGAIDRALKKAFGPRKARLYEKRADILLALGRRDEARASLEAELAHLRALPAPQKKPQLEAAVARRLEKLAR